MKRYVGQGPESSQVQEFLAQWDLGAPCSQHVDEFNKLEAPEPHCLEFLCKVSSHRNN